MVPLIFLFIAPFVNGDLIIQTNNGPVKGISLDTKNVDAFLGIPYAEPPVGNLRFAKPIPKSLWTDVFDAVKLPPACVQHKPMMKLLTKMFNDTGEMSEDCLYLNLWVPKSGSALKTVMVFIHGGGFNTGSSNIKIYDGATLSQHGDVIVALMNYRVGTLGFFSAFIDEASGSMGIYDQVLALKWIKDNAQHFGGDPDNIVIFGESAGAWSVSLHIVSPLSSNLFNKAILQSGSAISPMYSSDNKVLRAASQFIGEALGCTETKEDLTENPKKVVECMKNLPFEKFTEVDGLLRRTKKFLYFLPRVGDEFLPITPADSFRKGEFKDTEVLLGVTRDEGTMLVAIQADLESDEVFGEKFDLNVLNETLKIIIIEPFTKDENYDKIIQKYFKRVEKESRYTYMNAVSDFIGDSIITCGTVFQADFQSLKNHPVYFYVFDYRSPSSRLPEWLGVPHFEEVQYVFGNPLLREFSENEIELSKDVMDMWTAFAKTGNPNIAGGLRWPQYTYEDPKYLIISMRDKVGVRPDNYRCEAWRNLYRSTIDEEVFQYLQKSEE